MFFPDPFGNSIGLMGTMRFFDALVDLVLFHCQDAVVVGAADVRRAHPHRALGGRAVGGHLDRTDAQPLVPEAGAHPGRTQA